MRKRRKTGRSQGLPVVPGKHPPTGTCSTPRHLGVQRAAVPGLVHPEDASDPGHHLVGGWVGGLVQVDHPVAHVLLGKGIGRKNTGAGEGLF